jgi:hypothetical protein
MKNITFSAKEEAIEKARKTAARQHRTLNELFREWLDDVPVASTRNKKNPERFDELWEQVNYLRVGKRLSRDEMNER